ncbi:DNA-methyltransferase [Lederbergia citri]|uniref:Methyltransferase n=1 Tax=Lederbergia citri TaxID=2833580 RepID=A0A942TCX3_9BACI|nr:site-specific DNA-methyltransferase [Lederbergia citri]
MKRIPDGYIDMILCDLPYGRTRNKWDSIIPLDELWTQYERIIKDNGAIVLTCSQPFTTSLNASNISLYRYEWVWVKNNSTGFQLANKRPLKKHENISVFYKRQPTYNPQGLEPYGKTNKRGRTGENWSEMKNDSYVQEWTNYPTQLLDFPYDSEKYHPTQKPVALFEYLIRTYTNEGDIDLDNCIGSGTTAVAAINTGRQFIGIEKEPEYVEIGNRRIAEVTAVG